MPQSPKSQERVFTPGTDVPEALNLYEKFYAAAETRKAKVNQALDLIGKIIAGEVTNVEFLKTDTEVTEIRDTVDQLLRGNDGRGWDVLFEYSGDTEKVILSSPALVEYNESRPHFGAPPKDLSGEALENREKEQKKWALLGRVAFLKGAVVLVPTKQEEKVRAKTS